tara:strand:- start:1269 stop:1565 length:297 start_codon:yes stop_codon:yes gene_type:complete
MIRLQEVKVLKSFSQFREESLADRIAAAAKKNKTAIKNKRGVGKPKGFKDDEPELKANSPEAERIVRGMERQSLGRFKNLYGRRHKEVMYNTANKLAS